MRSRLMSMLPPERRPSALRGPGPKASRNQDSTPRITLMVSPSSSSSRSEEHTSELQSLTNLVCRLLLEKKKRPDEPNQLVSLNAHCTLLLLAISLTRLDL